MECMDELNLGVRGQTLGEDINRPPVASPTATDHTASSTDAPQVSFDVPCHTLIHLCPVGRWEQDYTSSESISRDLPPGVPLRTMPLTSTLR